MPHLVDKNCQGMTSTKEHNQTVLSGIENGIILVQISGITFQAESIKQLFRTVFCDLVFLSESFIVLAHSLFPSVQYVHVIDHGQGTL